MNLSDDGTYEVEYEHINRTIIDGNFTNISLINSKGNYGAIDADDTSCHGYYIIIFPHIYIPFKKNLIYMEKSFHMKKLCKGTYFPPITINSNYCVSSSNKANNTTISLRKIINGNINFKCYDSNDVFPYSLITMPKHISVHLHLYMYQHKNMII